MNSEELTRRHFLRQTASVAGATWARAALPGLAAVSVAACNAKEEQAPFELLEADEAVEFEAIIARIIPTTATPGAREAGVIYFFDKSLASFNAPMLPMLRSGLANLQSGLEDGRLFSDLSEQAQDSLLEANQETPFFGITRMMTFSGFFGMSEYGGNKDGIGWKLLGMDPDAHAYSYPFGYYDAEYSQENPDA